ncbi:MULTISPECIES: ABC transporter ATP-binding protein [unclassified Neisseria]|uniref:ABC transporter ATP-binding protein n=1 Tax=unclassified Neisseria TaxID=2623750 RepID=UPI001072A721|nr:MULTISPECIES: ABC transporter ATP-binding protein [unclassified Neisseria]MBF0803148.1 ABC transporter ATP-binding protein [Neisseria sp. 19428wB4_WF04]TFU44269.1 ABC transporter ATP-binding protein [Neisseria sp. WF04]
MILNVSQLSLSFGAKPVLQDFGFKLAEGEIACLLGHSGCGKTTALRAIAGFEQPNSGSITLKGQTLSDGRSFTPPHQRRIGMVFQDYALFPHLTVAQNIAFGLSGQSAAAQAQRVNGLLALTGLPEYGNHYPHQLSGGQQQRVALARALAPKPGLILLDEPFSNLDADLRARLSKEVRQLLKQEQTSAVLVTHDQQEAFAMADKIGIMHEGRLKQWDTPYNLYHRPADAHTARFIGTSVMLRGRVSGTNCVKLTVGEFCGTVPLGCQSCTEVDVLIRPDDIVHHHNSPITAEVLDKDFKGSHFIYTLKLDSGETVPAHIGGHHDHPIGSRIGIRMEIQDLIAFPAENQAV